MVDEKCQQNLLLESLGKNIEDLKMMVAAFKATDEDKEKEAKKAKKAQDEKHEEEKMEAKRASRDAAIKKAMDESDPDKKDAAIRKAMSDYDEKHEAFW